jgi:endogenous inhibitor of DNA gyrase (YacG/DUF329 family)
MKHTEETKIKISSKMKGKKPWCTGKHLKPRAICPNCGEFAKSRKHNYCSMRCSREHLNDSQFLPWVHGGSSIPTRTAKRFLLKFIGARCSVCSLVEWNGTPITLELEHKNGNSEDNTFINVCLLCPNCHSQTTTYKAKNRGNGRYSRRTRYKEGKSF